MRRFGPGPAALGALLWLFGCSDGGPSERTCEGIDCGPHGSCERGSCTCEVGYQPGVDGTSCEVFTIDPCEGITCSGLGSCVIEYLGPRGIRVGCDCQPPGVPTADGLDCIDVCVGVDCSPGSCTVGALDGPACDCPQGYGARSDPPRCEPQETTGWTLYYTGYEDYPLGHAWLKRQETAAGVVWSGTTSYSMVVNYQGGAVGGNLRTVARYQDDRLVEWVGDQDAVFGDVAARRRLHLNRSESADVPATMDFALYILESVWRGVMSLGWLQPGEDTPLPLPEIYEYPTFAFGSFDPLFFQLLVLHRGLPAAGEGWISVLIPSFALPSRLRVVVELSGGDGTIALPDLGTTAFYSGGLLSRVDYDWAFWAPQSDADFLEVGFSPLPASPIEHATPLPTETLEEAVSIPSAGGATLACTLSLPPDAPEPLAVLFAGSLLPETRDAPRYHQLPLRDMAAALAADGFASLRCDGRGTGESSGASNDPPADLAADLDAGAAWLRADPRFGQVALLGYGFGVPPALEGAGRLSPEALVLLAPSGPDLIADIYHRITAVILTAGLGQELADDYYRGFRQEFEAIRDGQTTEDEYGRSAAFWRDWLNRDPLDPGGYAGPALVLAAGEDLVLPPEHAALAAEALSGAGASVTVDTLPGVGHTFSPGAAADLWERFHLPEALEPALGARLADFLSQIVGKRGAP